MKQRPAPPTSPTTERKIIVDLFAGGGGASEAIFQATGRHPDVAVNHDRDAIAIHTVNHPTTRHYQEDVRTVDPVEACTFDGKVRRVGLLWASPDCTHFSKARGGKPVEKRIRSLADVVVTWVRAIKEATGHAPDIVMLENVEEFQSWGPVLENGKPCPEKKGLDFRRWVKELTDLGGHAEWREPIAANWGAPTTRKRLQMIIRFDGLPIVWPAPTHMSRAAWGKADLLTANLPLWRSAADDVVDWSIPVPSIFDREKALAEKTHARIFKGVKRYVLLAKRPFIVPITHTGPGRVHDVEDPVRTVTGANRGEFSLVAPTLVPRYGERPGQEPRALDAAEPYPTVAPGGNGGSLASVFLGKMAQNGQGKDLDDPLDTVMAGATKHYITAAHMARQFGSTVSGRDAEEPAATVVSDGAGGKSGIVATHLSSIAYGDDRPRAGLRASSVEDPTGTITGSNDKTVVATHLSRMAKGSVGSDSTDPTKTVTSHGKDALVGTYMAQANGDRVGRAGEEPVTTLTGRSTQQQLITAAFHKYYGTAGAVGVDAPLDTVTSKPRFGLDAFFMEQANTGVIGHAATDPVSTIVGKGSTQRVIDVALEAIGAPEGSKRRAVLQFLWTHAGVPTEAEWMDPMATEEGRVKFGLVVIDDVIWQITDIGMRMLVPRELFNAQGFPPTYVIDVTLEGRKITKTAQTKMAGNSVSPPPAIAHLIANLPAEMMIDRIAA